MELHQRLQIKEDAESLLSPANRSTLADYDHTKEEFALAIFGQSLVDLTDNQFDQVCDLAMKAVPNAEKVATDAAMIEDYLIESRRL